MNQKFAMVVGVVFLALGVMFFLLVSDTPGGNLTVEGCLFEETADGRQFEMTLRNRTDHDYTDAVVVALLLDENGSTVETLTQTKGIVPAGGTWTFRQPVDARVTTCEVTAIRTAEEVIRR